MMKLATCHVLRVCVVLLSLFLVSVIAACSHTAFENKPQDYVLKRVFPADAPSSVTFDRSIIASPLLFSEKGHPFIIVPVSDGVIGVLDGKTGLLVWKINVPAPKGQAVELIATPVRVEDKLVVIYQCLEQGIRVSHRMAVIDLSSKKVDDHFPVLEFVAQKPTSDGKGVVKFNPATAYSHAALKHAAKTGTALGHIYAAFGNASDVQPFHGWLFEIDLDAWLTYGAKRAIQHVLLTTPEENCPSTMQYGTQEMICGGGIWTPGGPLIVSSGNNTEIFVSTGNGQVDLPRHDYANAVMRVQPNLAFDAGCDANLCKDFQPKQPDRACIASCKNLFIPRPPTENLALKPSNRECDDKTFGECLAWMDYDIGGSTPVKVTLKNGQQLLVQPSKEGAVYLIDANHLGTQYERLQLVDVCGAPNDICKASWMGMIVTQPALAYLNEGPVIIIPTFEPDNTHPAGVFALTVVLEEGRPKLKQLWHVSGNRDDNASFGFRSHPSLPVISEGINHERIVWVVDIGPTGTLYGIRIKDGVVLIKQPLLGAGRQLSAPVIDDNTLFLASILPKTGKTLIEAYRLSIKP